MGNTELKRALQAIVIETTKNERNKLDPKVLEEIQKRFDEHLRGVRGMSREEAKKIAHEVLQAYQAPKPGHSS